MMNTLSRRKVTCLCSISFFAILLIALSVIMSSASVSPSDRISLVNFDFFQEDHEFYLRTSKGEIQLNLDQQRSVANLFQEMVLQKGFTPPRNAVAKKTAPDQSIVIKNKGAKLIEVDLFHASWADFHAKDSCDDELKLRLITGLETEEAKKPYSKLMSLLNKINRESLDHQWTPNY